MLLCEFGSGLGSSSKRRKAPFERHRPLATPHGAKRQHHRLTAVHALTETALRRGFKYSIKKNQIRSEIRSDATKTSPKSR
jgi:hypothetical protein